MYGDDRIGVNSRLERFAFLMKKGYFSCQNVSEKGVFSNNTRIIPNLTIGKV